MLLTDEQWLSIKPLIPDIPYRTGRPPLDARLVLEAALYKLAFHVAWYDLPGDFPSHQTVYRYHRLWRQKGIYRSIIHELYRDLYFRGEFDLVSARNNKEIDIVTRNGRNYFFFAPYLIGTWQLITAMLIIGLVINPTLNEPASFPHLGLHK